MGFKFNEREQQQLINILVYYIVSCMRVYVRVSESECECGCEQEWVKCEKTSVLWLVASHAKWRKIPVVLALAFGLAFLDSNRFDINRMGFASIRFDSTWGIQLLLLYAFDEIYVMRFHYSAQHKWYSARYGIWILSNVGVNTCVLHVI